MSCSCCCTNTLNFCKQDICGGEIDFDILAQKDGIHKLVLDYLNSSLTIEKLLAVGERIVFPIDSLNEGFEYTAELYDPDGVKIVIRKDDIDYDCVKFNTSLTVPLVIASEESA